jgi:hypothetical protein
MHILSCGTPRRNPLRLGFHTVCCNYAANLIQVAYSTRMTISKRDCASQRSGAVDRARPVQARARYLISSP